MGWYDLIDGGGSFKVKLIYVKLEPQISLHLHSHRLEH
jgi:mannose-6-phosphate isomerase-like protein (cupin superfamily)